jgi:hypothetical protein
VLALAHPLSETESEAKLQSIFYPWTKVNWMYHPEE